MAGRFDLRSDGPSPLHAAQVRAGVRPYDLVMRLYRVVAATLSVVTLAACSDDAPSQPTGTVVTYSCCNEKDIDKQYRPGETFSLHWAVAAQEGSPGSSAPELNARLVGPFGDVAELKQNKTGTTASESFAATPLHPSDSMADRPVSSIVIPVDAQPGYYNLIFSEQRGGSRVEGASIIRIMATG
jgi:hypothetical protein